MCVTLLGRPYAKKYVKGDVSIRDSLKKNASQRGLGSHRPPWYQSRVNAIQFQMFEVLASVSLKIQDMLCFTTYKTLKQSRYRPGVAQRVPGS